MPIGLDSSETVPVFLKSDKDKPIETRPAFLFHFITSAELRKVRRLRKELEVLKDDDDIEKKVDEILMVGLAGWRKMIGRDGKEIPYSPDLQLVTTFRERVELVYSFVAAVNLAEEELGKSGSPVESAAVSSADIAPQAA